MQPVKISNFGMILVACSCAWMGTVDTAEAVLMTVDEILFETNSTSDPALADLAPAVDMEFDAVARLLTVTLSNQACYSGFPDAGHLMTGVGFNLPSGVAIEDTCARDSKIWLPDGSVIVDPVSDPDGTSGIALSQDDWGYVNNVTSGHFANTAEASTTTVLSAMKADVATTFAGNAASNALMGSFDYGLQGLAPTPGHSNKRAIRNALAFDLYLDGPETTDWNSLLCYIENNPVVVSYGSPTGTSVPEPATWLIWCMLGSILLWRQRK